MPPENAVEFTGFSFGYGGTGRALSNINLKIPQGEFVGLIGETGSGKSTLLLSLNGIVPLMAGGKAEGSLRVMGMEPQQAGVKRMSRLVSFVFQNPDDQIFSSTVLDEVSFGPLNHGLQKKEAEAKAKQALSRVGLSGFEGRDPTELSFGQRQKVAVASALALEAPIMAFDEPVSGMDHKSACEIYAILSRLHKEGKTIIVVEHSDHIYRLATKVVVMKEGEVALFGGREALDSPIVEKMGIKKPCVCGRHRQ
jgi:energy-coupling factor transporter ATP-binding protein EcfA2